MAGHLGHLIHVLVLVFHGRAHVPVSHDVHDRKQVFGRPVHLSSGAMTRAIEDEVVWQPGLLSGFLELLSDRCEMPPRRVWKERSILPFAPSIVPEVPVEPAD